MAGAVVVSQPGTESVPSASRVSGPGPQPCRLRAQFPLKRLKGPPLSDYRPGAVNLSNHRGIAPAKAATQR